MFYRAYVGICRGDGTKNICRFPKIGGVGGTILRVLIKRIMVFLGL